MVPCSTQSQFPDLWSAPLRRAHWMPILGDPGAHAVGVPSRHGDPREDHGEALPQPRQEPTPAPRRPAPATLPVPSQPQWGSPEHNWDRPPSPPRPGSRPAPPGFAPPRARSRCAAHLHHGLPVSPAPTPGSRRASGTSLPPPGETGGQSIQPTEAIQAV